MQLPSITLPAVLRTRKGLIGLLVVLAAAGYFFTTRGTTLGDTFTVAVSDFKEQVSVSGTVTAVHDVVLGFAANGRIARTYAQVGQHIDAGSIVAEIENGDLAAALAQKQAALRVAEANLELIKKGTRPEEIAVAATTVANAKAALMNAIQNAYTASDDAVHTRVDAFMTNPRTVPKLAFSLSNAALQSMVEQDRSAVEPVLAEWALLVTKMSVDTVSESAKKAQGYSARIITLLADAGLALNQGIPDQTNSAATFAGYASGLATARSSVNTAATTLVADIAALQSAESTLALEQSGSTPEAIAAQEASVTAAAADVQSAQSQLAKTRVIAPFNGTVTRMDAKVGEVVAPTASVIAMQSDGIFQIETFIPEVTIARVAAGNPATTTLDAYGPSMAFPSVVVAVDPAETVKDGVPTYKTTLSFLNKDSRIRSGMTANVVIETGQLSNAIVIPAGAVGSKNGVSYVSVVDHGTASTRTVTVGPSPALGQAHILTGLAAGDSILLTPAP